MVIRRGKKMKDKLNNHYCLNGKFLLLEISCFSLSKQPGNATELMNIYTYTHIHVYVCMY